MRLCGKQHVAACGGHCRLHLAAASRLESLADSRRCVVHAMLLPISSTFAGLRCSIGAPCGLGRVCGRWSNACWSLVCHLPKKKLGSRLLDAAIGSRMSDANGAELGVAGIASVLPPSYVDFKDLIRSEMTAVKAKMAELRKLHGQVRGVSHDTPAECGTQRDGLYAACDRQPLRQLLMGRPNTPARAAWAS